MSNDMITLRYVISRNPNKRRSWVLQSVVEGRAWFGKATTLGKYSSKASALCVARLLAGRTSQIDVEA